MNFKQYLQALNSRPIPKELAFDESEYRRRLDRVRALMAERGLDALLVTEVPNVCYLSGYDTFPFADFINAKRIVRHRLIAEIAKT